MSLPRLCLLRQQRLDEPWPDICLATVGSDGGCSESMAVPIQTAREHGSPHPDSQEAWLSSCFLPRWLLVASVVVAQ